MFSYSCEKWSQLPPRSGVETDGGRQSNSVLPTRLAPPTRRAPPELNRAFAPEARLGQRLPFSHPDADHHSHSPRHANRARSLHSRVGVEPQLIELGPSFSQKRERRRWGGLCALSGGEMSRSSSRGSAPVFYLKIHIFFAKFLSPHKGKLFILALSPRGPAGFLATLPLLLHLCFFFCKFLIDLLESVLASSFFFFNFCCWFRSGRRSA